jgi:ketopantoate reductase
MGQLFGARLQLAGEDVTLFDTQQRTIDALTPPGSPWRPRRAPNMSR